MGGVLGVDMGKVLLSDGDWTIEELRSAPDDHMGFRTKQSRFITLVKHVCFPEGELQFKDDKITVINSVHQVVVYPDDAHSCWRCTKPIPEGIQAVWKFQNWEALEYGG